MYVCVHPSSRFTALHYAVQSNSTDSVRAFTLVNNTSHLPDANEGRTPLMIAAQNAAHPIVKVQFITHVYIIYHICIKRFAQTAYPILQTLLESRAVIKTINHADNEGKTGYKITSNFV